MSSVGPFGPAPPGVDLSENQNVSIYSSVIAIMAVGVTSVALRLVARLGGAGNGMDLDDYFILCAVLFAIGTAVCCIISVPFGGGQHAWAMTAENFNKLWQTTYAFVLIYATAVSLTKASILLFYRRIFGANQAFWVCTFLVAAYWVAIVTAWFSGCRPASYFWEQYTNPNAKGYCMNTSLFYFINGICAMLIDICILLVPIPIVYRLQMPAGQKLAVSAILLLGAFVCVASVVRITVMDALVKSEDVTWAMSPVFIWSCCEPFIGIVCACLPTYAPLVRRWWTTISISNRGVSEEASSDPRPNGSNGEWNRINSSKKLFRSDDEVELTNNVLCGKKGSQRASINTSDEELGLRPEIMVQRDISWISTSRP